MSIITIIDRDVLTAGFDLLSGTISTTLVASDWRSSDYSDTNNIFHELFSQQ